MSTPGKPDPPEQIEKALADWRKRIADRERAEDEGRQKLVKARIEYEVAKSSFDQAVREAHSVGLNNPDGAHGLSVATRKFNEAIRRYRHMLQTFSDLIGENLPTKPKPKDF